MNGVHDMGGMHGPGPIVTEADEPVFHEPWEGRAFALNIAAGAWGRWTLDGGRHQRELIPGAEYLRMSYYEKWIAGLVELLANTGLATREELETGRPASGSPKASPPMTAERVGPSLGRRGASTRTIDAAPRFAIGDPVQARNLNPIGHTRLPRYVRGRRGAVTAHHGAHVFPDTNAHGLGEQPQHLYQVRFEAKELWGDAAEQRSAVYLDLWESYLERL
jgi:nitrile hydratase beta subunit